MGIFQVRRPNHLVAIFTHAAQLQKPNVHNYNRNFVRLQVLTIKSHAI
jgi:hypothetical protein